MIKTALLTFLAAVVVAFGAANAYAQTMTPWPTTMPDQNRQDMDRQGGSPQEGVGGSGSTWNPNAPQTGMGGTAQ